MIRRGLQTATSAATSPIKKFVNGVAYGWITSPGPIAGVSVQVNLSSLDSLLPPSKTTLKPNIVDMSLSNPWAEYSHLSLIPFILEKFAFKRTKILSEGKLNERLERLIGSATTKNNRHSLLWSCTVPEEQIAESVSLLGELSQGPGEFSDEDVEELYKMLKYEAWELIQPLNFEELLKHLIHRAAFDSSRTILATSSPINFAQGLEDEDAGAKNEVCSMIRKAGKVIQQYWRDVVLKEPEKHFCIVGSGAIAESQNIFTIAAEATFGKNVSNQKPPGVSEVGAADNTVYAGGLLNWSSAESPLLNVSVALNSPPTSASIGEQIPLAILQMILGGGGSFSAGGPGKGMYSRLYTQLLNRFSWLEHSRAFSLDYPTQRSGSLFGINASCLPDRAPQLVKVLLSHLSTQLTASLTSTELSRAKNQLKSAILMGLEVRSLMLESFAQQVASERYLSPEELCVRIDDTTEEELTVVARKLVRNGQLSVAAYGQTDHLPSYAEIQDLYATQFASKMK